MSVNKLVSIKNAIVDASDMLALDHNTFLPMFMSWATYAEKEIGGQGIIRKFAVLDVCGCTANLPDDLFKIKGAILGNYPGDCVGIFNNFLSSSSYSGARVNNSFLVVDVGSIGNDTSYGMVNYEIQDNKIVLGCHSNVTHITIMYEGFASDCDGFIKIGENHVEAISTYIQYKYWLRKQKKTNSDMAMMQFAYREWDRLCAHARALDSELTDSQREGIAQLNNDPYAGRGLYVGMITNNEYGEINY